MKKILLIEDNSFIANLYRNRLESHEYAVNIARDGQSGYYAISETKPDAVLLDLTLPQMDAVSVLGKVRAQKQFHKLPIFVLADSHICNSVDDAMNAGATHCFNKADLNCLSDVVASLNGLFSSFLRTPSAPPSFAPAAGADYNSATDEAFPETTAPFQNREFEHDPQAVYSRSREALASVHASKRQNPFLFANESLATNGHRARPKPPEIDAAAILAELQDHFLESYGHTVHTIRGLFVSLINTKIPAEGWSKLEELWTQIRSLRSSAEQCGMCALARLCAPLEALTAGIMKAETDKSLANLPKLANTIDFLAALNKHLSEIEPLNRIQPRVLVVDDQNVSRKALTLSLEKAEITVAGAKDCSTALIAAEGSLFDLMFLDVEMLGITGFALCARIRMLPAQKTTPIIFVSALEDLKTRASSRISGGNHFLTKPVNFDEVNMIALTYIFKNRLQEMLRKNGDQGWAEFR